tara:strand:+ start:3909 stop:4709 length:801 start_codon:yes stop_codon:yes gene_type:complete
MATTNLGANFSGTVFSGAFGDATFTAARNETAADGAYGNSVTQNPDSDYVIVAAYAADIFGLNNRSHWVGFYMLDFDLSSISTTITGLTLKLKGKSVTAIGDVATGTSTMHDADAIILKSEHQDTPDLTDINNFTGHQDGYDADDVTEFSSAFGTAAGGWNIGSYNEITLNSDAVSDANTQKAAGNRFKMCAINKSRTYDNDATNLGDSTGAYNRDYYYLNFEADTENSDPPTLVVTHEDAPVVILPTLSLKGGNLSLKGGTLTIK